MNQLRFLILVLVVLLFYVEAQSTLATEDGPTASDTGAGANFQPSLGFVIGVLCIMFIVSFFLLIYAKFCHRGAAAIETRPGLVRSTSRFSGIDKTVIESLPFFRFSSLKGSREGLECSVCLSKFEDIEILRLLPKCKHAFHINCVDQWLEKHSSCPLCRTKVDPQDPTIFTYSNSMRFSGLQSQHSENSNVELFIQREESSRGSSRFGIGSSFRKVETQNKEEESSILEMADGNNETDDKLLHKYNHRIIVSDFVFKNRWSNVSSSDLMFLNSEMLNNMSSDRFSSLDSKEEQQLMTSSSTIQDEQIVKIKEEMEMKRLFENKVSSAINQKPPIPTRIHQTSDALNTIQSHTPRIMASADRRAVSEITAFSRFKSFDANNRSKDVESSSTGGSNLKEETRRQLWLPIARRTVQWFANRERRPQHIQSTTPTQTLDV